MEDLKYYNSKLNDFDKYSKESRDMEFRGNISRAKQCKEKAENIKREISKVIQVREKNNSKFIKKFY